MLCHYPIAKTHNQSSPSHSLASTVVIWWSRSQLFALQRALHTRVCTVHFALYFHFWLMWVVMIIIWTFKNLKASLHFLYMLLSGCSSFFCCTTELGVKLRKREIDTRITIWRWSWEAHVCIPDSELREGEKKREVKNRFAYISITTPDETTTSDRWGPLGNWVECIEKLETLSTCRFLEASIVWCRKKEHRKKTWIFDCSMVC